MVYSSKNEESNSDFSSVVNSNNHEAAEYLPPTLDEDFVVAKILEGLADCDAGRYVDFVDFRTQLEDPTFPLALKIKATSSSTL